MKEFINLRDLFKPQNIFLLVLSISALFYTGYRSFSLSFTHDESYTFIKYINYPVWDLITYHVKPVIANNHPLNTISMKLFDSLFGNTEFALRIHSFFSHFLYIIFTYLILRESKSKTIIVLGFIILNCNPYLLDFFSLARGYAMSISLMLMSIYFFFKFTKQIKPLYYLIICLITSLFAVLANFSLISFSVSIIFVIEFFLLVNKTPVKTFLKYQIPVFLTTILLFLIYIGPIKILLECGELSFGGNSGLWSDTVFSCISVYLYSTPYFDTLTYFLLFLVVFTSFASFIVVFKQIRSGTETIFTYIPIILFLIIGASIAQHLFLNGSYFKERFALFLVPLFFFSFINVIDFYIFQKKVVRFSGYILITLVSACAISIMYTSVNLDFCLSWKYDATTKEMISDIERQADKSKKTKLGITWLFEPSINFYRDTKSIDWLEEVNRDGLNGNYDFYYVGADDLNSFDKSNKILVKTYPQSGATLFKRIISNH